MIKLDNDYMIDVDSYNYTLIRDKHKKDNKGKSLTAAVGYYGNLSGCLKRYAELIAINQLQNGDFSLEEAIKIIDESNNKLIDMLNKRLPDINKQIDSMLEDDLK